jgi:hypothetical protein
LITVREKPSEPTLFHEALFSKATDVYRMRDFDLSFLPAAISHDGSYGGTRDGGLSVLAQLWLVFLEVHDNTLKEL